MIVKVKKLNDDAVIPAYATEGSVGMDLTAVGLEYDIQKDRYIYHTGLAFEIPKGYVDKNNLRQNYIHVLELNGIEIKKEPINEYWNGQKVEIRPPTVNELKEFDELLKDFM